MNRSTTHLVTATLGIASLVLIGGCSKSSSDNGGEAPAPPATAPSEATGGMMPEMPGMSLAAFENESVEIGCGMCVYELDGVDACTPAIAIAGKHLLVTGV